MYSIQNEDAQAKTWDNEADALLLSLRYSRQMRIERRVKGGGYELRPHPCKRASSITDPPRRSLLDHSLP